MLLSTAAPAVASAVGIGDLWTTSSPPHRRHRRLPSNFSISASPLLYAKGCGWKRGVRVCRIGFGPGTRTIHRSPTRRYKRALGCTVPGSASMDLDQRTFELRKITCAQSLYTCGVRAVERSLSIRTPCRRRVARSIEPQA